MIQKARIIFLADVNSAHTQKWVIALVNEGIEVGLCTLSKPKDDWYVKYPSITIVYSPKFNAHNSLVSKLVYLMALPSVKRAIKKFKPDILHSHYATSYGLIGVLSKFHPLIISAWGSDVMDFPTYSVLHKKLLKYNLSHADVILATSNTIVNAIHEVTSVDAVVVPFGVDINYFKPQLAEMISDKKTIVIGTVKSLEKIYAIDVLMHAFKKVKERHPEIKLKLLIVGGGSLEQELKVLAEELSISSVVEFTGKVKFDSVVDYHNKIDVFVNVSRNESFGVSIIEASACGKPVVASNVGGLPDVVIKNETAILVEPDNIEQTVAAIEKLILDESLRQQMGNRGREFVMSNYNFEKNILQTLEIYNQYINKN